MNKMKHEYSGHPTAKKEDCPWCNEQQNVLEKVWVVYRLVPSMDGGMQRHIDVICSTEEKAIKCCSKIEGRTGPRNRRLYEEWILDQEEQPELRENEKD